MVMMKTNARQKSKWIIWGIVILFLLVILMSAAFYMGKRQSQDELKLLRETKMSRESDYAKGLSQLQTEQNRALSDYQAACFEYQELYQAYNDLYEQRGRGLERYSSPDAARGNEESCYR